MDNNNLQNTINRELKQSQQPPQSKSTDPFAFQKALRTYQSDAAQTINQKKVSVAKIAIAESVKRTGTESIGTKVMPGSEIEGKKKSGGIGGFFVFLISIVLILGGAGGAYWLYLESPLAGSTPAAPVAYMYPSILAPAKQEVLTAQGSSVAAFQNFLVERKKLTGLTLNQIEEIVITRGATSTDRITTASLLALLGAEPPQSFVRSLTPEYMLGYIQTRTKNPFLILKTSFFQSAFSGMLNWENRIYDEIGIIFEDVSTRRPIPTFNSSTPVATTTLSLATSTGSTTSPTASSTMSTSTPASEIVSDTLETDLRDIRYFRQILTYKDVIIKNRDVRVLEREDGSSVFAYSFIDSETLLLAPDISTIEALINALDNTIYTR